MFPNPGRDSTNSTEQFTVRIGCPWLCSLSKLVMVLVLFASPEVC